MEEYVGKICPFCKAEIHAGDAVKVCPECGIPHHASCWEENKGCTTFGCLEQYYESEHTNQKQQTTRTDICVKCGSPLGEGQAFCPKCGTPKGANTQKRFCNKCGAELQEGQAFCPKCGQKADLQIDVGVNATTSQFNTNMNKENSKKGRNKLYIGIAAGITILAIAFAVFGNGNRKDFNKLYGDLADNSWCTIASDGSYMKLDTNPKDKDSDDLTLSDYINFVTPASEAIERINKELGFSDALMAKMNTTTWSQGKQSDSNDKYTVTWTYHPDKGLEVMYEFKK